jgi:hypothetical protein
MRFTLTLAVLAGSVAGMPTAASADEPIVSAVTHSGSGCPQDSAVETTDGGKSYKIHGFSSRAPGVNATQNCALHLTTGGQAQYQLSLKHATVRAWGYFPNGSGLNYFLTNFWTSTPEKTVSGRAATLVELGADESDQGTVSGSWTNNGGTVNGPLVIEIEVPASERVWSQCGETDIMNPNFRAVIQDTGYYGTRNSVVTTETLTYVSREC